MKTNEYRILSIGAHPDDADTSAAGLLLKLFHRGWSVRMLSLTDGSAGTWDPSKGGSELADLRREEAARSGALLGGRYDVWDLSDGRLEASIENRERLIRYIREFSPNIILTNRPNDYHPDHRNTALLVTDAAYLLTVPYICKETTHMGRMPVILYWSDDFQRPYPFAPDIIVPVDGYEEERVQLSCCHESQYFDWLYEPERTDHRNWPRDKQIQELRERNAQRGKRDLELVREAMQTRLGSQRVKGIRTVENYEVCEFGEDPSDELIALLEE